MIERVIRWSAANQLIVLLAAAFIAAAGVFAVNRTPLDALPDLSDVQVIIRTPYPGQAPQIVESQVTYPLATTMLSAPKVKAVRAFSFFGDSFVTVIFEDGTDLYWARSRTLEYLNQAAGRMPAGVTPALGPDATGVGWAYQYALIDRTGHNDLGQLRALQDWQLKYQLKEIPGVAEVASVGGMVRAFQVQADPEKLQFYRISLNDVMDAIKTANNETGGSVIERAEAEYMIRVGGYLKTLDDFRNIPLKVSETGVPITIGDIARVQIVPDFRRGIAELNGQGEVAGGVIVVRAGADTRAVIDAVKAKLEDLKASLPPGVEVVTVYDRTSVIDRAVENLTHKLFEEFMVVAIVCVIFLLHFRSSLVAILTLPLGVLAAFIVMYMQGVNANILSLGGIALAIGAMVDAAVVMIENAHKKLEHAEHEHGGMTEKLRRKTLIEAAVEVGPALFFSLLIITLSFLPVFSLEAQEGKLFKPLALTKTYSMAAAAGLSVTLIPVLMIMFIKGKILPEEKNPINRFLIAAYRPALTWVMHRPKLVLALALATILATAWPMSRLGGEFMPAIAEGDLLYMPTALPGLSASKASELLQTTNRMIKTVPEVKTVFGKAGRADTATDPAPIEMFETTIQLKPQEEWRPGMTMDKIVAELDSQVKVPGLANVFVPPIRNRIDMLATGIKSPVGVKITGPDLATLDRLGAQIAQVIKGVPGTSSAISDRILGGRYVDIQIDRLAAARYRLSIKDVQNTAAAAVGGMQVDQKIEGLARFPINVRFPRESRDSVEALQNLPIVAPTGGIVPLGAVAKIQIADGPVMVKSENARPSAWVYVDVRGRDIVGYVNEARQRVVKEVPLPPGYSMIWSGQFEYAERASQRLMWIVPATIAVIFLLLYMAFKRAREALIVLSTLPFALVGGVWLIYLLGHAFSIATAVGFIALSGLAAEFGVIMLVYLDRAIEERIEAGKFETTEDLEDALMEGAVLRVRPKAMTAAVILAGLFPLLIGTGTGSEVMQRLAAPMIGGMITAPLLSLFVLPTVYKLLGVKRFLHRAGDPEDEAPKLPAAHPDPA